MGCCVLPFIYFVCLLNFLLFFPLPCSSQFLLTFLSIFSSFHNKFLSLSLLFLIASFRRVRDVNGWLADREEFEAEAIKSKVDPPKQLFDLEYEVLEEGFLLSKSHTEGGVEDGYF